MPFWTYTYQKINNDGTLTSIPSSCVTAGTWTSNKLNVTDPVTTSLGELRGRLPASMPSISVGDGIRITATNGANTIERDLLINDYIVNYGMVPNADTWTMALEDVLAQIGRANATFSWSANIKTQAAAQLIANASGWELNQITPDPSKSLVSAQSFTNENCLDILRKLAYTEEGRVASQGATLYPFTGTTIWFWVFLPRPAYTNVAGVLTDNVTNLATQIAYDNVAFSGIGDNYWNKAIVEPSGLAAQSSGTGTRAYIVQTYDVSTTQALYNAQYIAAQLTSATATPRTISFLQEAQGGYYKQIGDVVQVTLRGSSYYAAVLSQTWSWTPQETRVTLNLAPYSSSNWLVLNNTVLGRLDYNKLGF